MNDRSHRRGMMIERGGVGVSGMGKVQRKTGRNAKGIHYFGPADAFTLERRKGIALGYNISGEIAWKRPPGPPGRCGGWVGHVRSASWMRRRGESGGHDLLLLLH
jgi:hypothetical protein